MNYESWKALPPSFRNDCSKKKKKKWLFNNSPQQLTGKGVGYWLGAASKQNRNTYPVPYWDAEQVWAEAGGIRAPPPGQRAITQRAHKTHISTSISAASMRHFWSLLWQGTLKFGSSFRKVKRRSLQVNDHLYQEHQQTCTESHASQPGRCRRLTWGKCNRTRSDHVPSGGFQVRWEFSKTFSQLRWNSFTSRQAKCKYSWSLPWQHYLKFHLIPPLLILNPALFFSSMMLF